MAKHWKFYQTFNSQNLSKTVLSWLLEPNSLTQRIKKQCQQFYLQVNKQSWQAITLEERLLLGLTDRQWANVREIQMICDGKLWIKARTIFPRRTLTGPELRLLKIGNKPIGQLLFEHPDMERGKFEIRRIKSRNGNLYARRSLFYLSGKPLLVAEYFMEDFPF